MRFEPGSPDCKGSAVITRLSQPVHIKFLLYHKSAKLQVYIYLNITLQSIRGISGHRPFQGFCCALWGLFSFSAAANCKKIKQFCSTYISFTAIQHAINIPATIPASSAKYSVHYKSKVRINLHFKVQYLVIQTEYMSISGHSTIHLFIVFGYCD